MEVDFFLVPRDLDRGLTSYSSSCSQSIEAFLDDLFEEDLRGLNSKSSSSSSSNFALDAFFGGVFGFEGLAGGALGLAGWLLGLLEGLPSCNVPDCLAILEFTGGFGLDLPLDLLCGPNGLGGPWGPRKGPPLLGGCCCLGGGLCCRLGGGFCCLGGGLCC